MSGPVFVVVDVEVCVLVEVLVVVLVSVEVVVLVSAEVVVLVLIDVVSFAAGFSLEPHYIRAPKHKDNPNIENIDFLIFISFSFKR